MKISNTSVMQINLNLMFGFIFLIGKPNVLVSKYLDNNLK